MGFGAHDFWTAGGFFLPALGPAAGSQTGSWVRTRQPQGRHTIHGWEIPYFQWRFSSLGKSFNSMGDDSQIVHDGTSWYYEFLGFNDFELLISTDDKICLKKTLPISNSPLRAKQLDFLDCS